ncbi:MAG: ribonuclease HI family protein, partial [Candidatus Yanofskybacteria bacterium]|nr:ribonuclease HI family protein [Candidatus Yanofskybacteria bacterium]
MSLPAKKYVIHTDGGSRGNPGPAAIGAVIEEEGGVLRKEYGEYIGRATNNEAEYKAAIFALKKLKQLIGKEKAFASKVEIKVDSELLERQINGRYKILDSNIQPLFLELWNLKIDFSDIKFK